MDDKAKTPGEPLAPAHKPQVTKAPLSSVEPAAAAPAPHAPKQPKKNLRAAIIIAAVVVIGATLALLYAFWYQNPQKVITDSVVRMIQSKSVSYTGSVKVTGGTEMTIEMDGASADKASHVNAKIGFKVDGKQYSLAANAVVNGSEDVYFKLSNVDQLAKVMTNQMSAEAAKQVKPTIEKIVAKVNNQWIKISDSDLSDMGSSNKKLTTCVGDAMEKFQSSKSANAEIGKIYRQNQFIVVDEKLGSKDGSLGYKLSGDAGKAKLFVEGLTQTQIYKDLKACDKSFELDPEELLEDTGKGKTPRVEIWINRWSHDITKFSIEGEDSNASRTAIVIEPVFNKTNQVEQAPKSSTPLKALVEDVQQLFAEFIQTSAGGRTSGVDSSDDGYDSYDL